MEFADAPVTIFERLRVQNEQVPVYVEKIVQKEVPVPVERIVEKIVEKEVVKEIPVERIIIQEVCVPPILNTTLLPSLRRGAPLRLVSADSHCAHSHPRNYVVDVARAFLLGRARA
jgi:hypothetical protein